MPSRLLDFIQNTDEKLLAKFEDAYGVHILLRNAVTSTNTRADHVEITIELQGGAWCVDQIYQEMIMVCFSHKESTSGSHPVFVAAEAREASRW